MDNDLQAQANEAKLRYEEEPTLDNLIWYGRRVAYTGDYDRSIEIYTEGLQKYPRSAKLLRDRGHRQISLRNFDKAISDLSKAKELIQHKEDEIEPDGMPNSKNIPLSTLHFNIYYHLGLTYYLVGDFEKAYEVYTSCLEVSNNDDSVVACGYWLYLITNRHQEVPEYYIPELDNMEIIENFSYYQLLKLFTNRITEQELLKHTENAIDMATINYGLAMYHYFQQNLARAKNLLTKNIKNHHPAAFGTIASEVELNRFE